MADAKIKITAEDATDVAIRRAIANFKSMENEVSKTKATIVGLSASIAGIAGSVGVAYVAFENLTKKAGDFQDMAEKTGDTAQNIASLAVAAGTAGVGMDLVVSASNKLTKGLTGVDDESKAAGAAIAALGLNLKDFKALAPVDRMEAIAKSLQKFQEGPEKTAVAIALLGKEGAGLLPFLNELGAAGGRQVILTQEQIVQADAYGDKQAKLRTELGLHAAAIASQLIPAYSLLTEALTETAKEILGITDGVAGMTQGDHIKAFAQDGALFLAELADVAYDAAQAFHFIGANLVAMKNIAAANLRLDFAGAEALGAASDEQNKKILAGLGLADKVAARIAALKDAPVRQLASGASRLAHTIGTQSEQDSNNRTKLTFDGVDTSKTAKAPSHHADNFINQLITEYANLSGQMSKVEEVTRKLDTASEKFSTTERARALELAGQIDQQKLKATLLEHEIKGLQEQDTALQASETAYQANILAMLDSAQVQQFEVSLLGKNAAAVEKLRFERELSKEVVKAESQVLDEQTQGLITQAEALERLAAIKRFAGERRAGFDTLQGDKLDQQNNAGRGVNEGIKTYLESVEKAGDSAKNAVVSAFGGMEDAFTSFVKTRKLDFSSLADSIISDMIRMTMQKNITGPLAAMASTALTGFMSFDGGGYTGAGSRSGGIDGKGGFLATLHPQETVVDHTKGGQGGGAVTVVQNFTVGDVASVSLVRQAVAGSERRIAAGMGRSMNYGGALA